MIKLKLKTSKLSVSKGYLISIYTLLVCLYPKNVKTAELIGRKFCVGPHMTPGKVLLDSCSKLHSSVTKSFWIFLKFLKCAKNIIKSTNLFLLLF